MSTLIQLTINNKEFYHRSLLNVACVILELTLSGLFLDQPKLSILMDCTQSWKYM